MQQVLGKKHSEFLLALLLLFLLILASTHLSTISTGVSTALSLCARVIIPTLFPFLILTDLILSTNAGKPLLSKIGRPLAKLFRLSDNGGVVILLGALFGFPMGARAVARYYSEGGLSKEESERLLLFSGNASPFFLIGSVGSGMLSSVRAGFTIYLIQLTVSLGCGLLLSLFAPKTANRSHALARATNKTTFSHTVQNAVRQSLFISGYIVFFSAILSIALPFVKNAFLSCLLSSLLEIGNGCSHATKLHCFTLPFCAFSACFSGFSVYFQTLDCICDSNLETKRYLPTKLLCGAVGFHLALLFR